jgi:predicted nucleic acid-binding protein
MLVADTSIWIDYFNGVQNERVAVLDDALQLEEVAIGDLILFEVLQGFRTEHEVAAARSQLALCELFHMVSPELALRAAQCYRHFRRRGITIRSSIDCLIATAVIAGDHILLHNDRDFDHFEKHLGLRVMHPPIAPMEKDS